jgi:predicted nucleic acid-binding protein
MHLDSGRYRPAVSVPLVLEYEAATKRLIKELSVTVEDVDAIIDFLCAKAILSKVYYLWRPALKDPKDDMVLETAVAAGCAYIVTFNVKDFSGAEHFNINVVTPKEFLAGIGGL